MGHRDDGRRGERAPAAREGIERDLAFGGELTTRPAHDVTGWLLAWQQGEAGVLDKLLPVVYEELRRIAHARMRAEAPGRRTLQTTALVNEAYVRLVEGAEVAWRDRAHFYAVCARLMRRILVDRARARGARKRQDGGALAAFAAGEVPSDGEALLALDEALDRLAAAAPRKADVVVLRYFGGLTLEETAASLNVSVETVKRDWKVARLWLRQQLEPR